MASVHAPCRSAIVVAGVALMAIIALGVWSPTAHHGSTLLEEQRGEDGRRRGHAHINLVLQWEEMKALPVSLKTTHPRVEQLMEGGKGD